MADDQAIRYTNVKELGETIAAARLRTGLSQRQVAEAAGATKHWVWTIEHGQVQGADTTRLIAVAQAVGLGFALVPLTGLTGPEK